MSFYTSLSGLKASQTEMSTISHNLANVSTNGFKRSDTEFADVIASSVSVNPTKMIGSGTVVKSIRQQFSQGNLVQSESSLDLAITGDGFFAVKPAAGGTQINYTRNGSFLVNADRYVVDGQGNHVQIYPVDGSGNVFATSASALTSLRLPATSGTPSATQNVALAVNLGATTEVPAKATFDRFDASSYNKAVTTTVYDSNGSPMTMTTYYKRVSAPIATVPPAAPDLSSTWEAHTFVGDQKMQSGTGDFIQLTFDATGTLTAPSTPTQFGVFTPSNTASNQQITIDFAGTTQRTAAGEVLTQTQDGVPVGELQGVTIDENGFVKASFSNGDNQVLGKIALVNFSNPSGLRQLGNSTWASTGISGEPTFGQANADGLGALMSGAVESSNVDITEELVSLIAAQRNFQANAKALDTSSKISETIFNIR
ncbi:flagellar hook protein FlgE [Hephaestia sp. GCM10023244]|uniref:flagellar hook protein FlgE n=1 Tax=unclassified Hephaestia TaxID=2631281 RepID=UPI002076E26F|nr:flagellar hook protein FlgE [Hephaestia sp. MAHUQ-44]MCM8731244.1 flagellar hook protein FlgE [Hephaestia sp. MAHUQ-44]